MSESPSWPPPPDTPAPLSEHDDFLAACIRDWKLGQVILRGQLAGKLCEKTGLKYNSCLPFVNNFCDRHAILVPTHSLIVWLPILLPLIFQTMRAAVAYVLEQRHDAAITYAERMMITAEERQADWIIIGAWVIASIVAGVFAFFRQKKMRRQAAEARAKFAR